MSHPTYDFLTPAARRYLPVKRALDVLLSGCGIVVLSPVLLVTAILVRTKLGSPVIFCQERPGKDEKIFRLYKFRSMTDEKDENGNLLPDEIRLTRFGRLLRSTSLDELPEIALMNFSARPNPEEQPPAEAAPAEDGT